MMQLLYLNSRISTCHISRKEKHAPALQKRKAWRDLLRSFFHKSTMTWKYRQEHSLILKRESIMSKMQSTVPVISSQNGSTRIFMLGKGSASFFSVNL